MNMTNARIIPPNIVVIGSPIRNYSPIDVINLHMARLNKTIKTYFVLNTDLKIMHKVVIHPSHIESIEIILY